MNENVQIDAEEAEVVVHVVVADLVEETEEATDSRVVTKTATLEIIILRTVSPESVYASHAGT